LALNPAVNAPNIPCFKSPLLPIMPDNKTRYLHYDNLGSIVIAIFGHATIGIVSVGSVSISITTTTSN
jgi:hypothetical protein